MFEALGMVGIGLSVVAYLPQVSHLAKEHCHPPAPHPPAPTQLTANPRNTTNPKELLH